MTRRLTLYTRQGCCLCEEMKEVIGRVAGELPLDLEEIDVDGAPDLKEKYGNEVPVLFINGRKAFKYRIEPRRFLERLRAPR